MKIRITGGSGSGKSYLGSLLEKETGIKHTPIDFLVYDFSKSSKFCQKNKRKDDEIRKLLNQTIKKNNWIVDGGYYSHTEDTYKQADIIIFLKPRFLKRIINTFKRFFIRLFQGKYEGLGNFLSLTAYNIRTRNKWQKEREKLFRKIYKSKMHVFHSADEAYNWFKKT